MSRSFPIHENLLGFADRAFARPCGITAMSQPDNAKDIETDILQMATGSSTI
jgi:hypothetical protein